jgi:hypothetical protein
MKKTIFALAAAGLVMSTLLTPPSPAEARDRGGAVAAGIIGGIAAGAILGSALSGPRYYEPAPVYVAPPPPPAYYYEEYGDGPICHVERRRVWVEGYGWRKRRIEVCD